MAGAVRGNVDAVAAADLVASTMPDVTRTLCVAPIERDHADHRSVEIEYEKTRARRGHLRSTSDRQDVPSLPAPTAAASPGCGLPRSG